MAAFGGNAAVLRTDRLLPHLRTKWQWIMQRIYEKLPSSPHQSGLGNEICPACPAPALLVQNVPIEANKCMVCVCVKCIRLTALIGCRCIFSWAAGGLVIDLTLELAVASARSKSNKFPLRPKMSRSNRIKSSWRTTSRISVKNEACESHYISASGPKKKRQQSRIWLHPLRITTSKCWAVTWFNVHTLP